MTVRTGVMLICWEPSCWRMAFFWGTDTLLQIKTAGWMINDDQIAGCQSHPVSGPPKRVCFNCPRVGCMGCTGDWQKVTEPIALEEADEPQA